MQTAMQSLDDTLNIKASAGAHSKSRLEKDVRMIAAELQSQKVYERQEEGQRAYAAFKNIDPLFANIDKNKITTWLKRSVRNVLEAQ
jgi:hypothetical protein